MPGAPSREVVPAVALVALLVTAYAHPRGRSGVFEAAAGWVRRVGRDRPVPPVTGALLLVALLATVLANLLWRRTLVRQGRRPTWKEFHRVSLVVTPICLLGAVTTLALVTQ